MRVSDFLSKAVNDLADALNSVAKQVNEFQESLKKVRSDLKTAHVTAVSTASVPLLATEATTAGPSSNNMFDFLEGDTAAMATTAEPAGLAESILLGEEAGPTVTPTAAPPSAPPEGPPSAPPAGPPKAPPTGPPKAPAVTPPSAPPAAQPPAAMPDATPPPVAPGVPQPAEGIASLRSEMMAEIKRIKEIFES